MAETDVSKSILNSTKKALGLDASYDAFDVDILIHINAVFAIMHQLGVGPADGFEVEDESALWDDFLGGNKKLNMAKSLVYVRVRLLFDPPQTSFATDPVEKIAKEYEWRLMAVIETEKRQALQNESGLVWVIDSNEEFPQEADDGAFGFDPVNGSVWRKKNA